MMMSWSWPSLLQSWKWQREGGHVSHSFRVDLTFRRELDLLDYPTELYWFILVTA